MINLLQVQEFLNHWNQRKTIKGKSFDDLFKIEGVSLWWFFRKFFYPHVMPKPINPFEFIEKEKKLRIIEKLKLFLGAVALKKYLQVVENQKISYLKKIKSPDKKDKKILLLTYSNHLSDDGKLFRLDGIIRKIRTDKKFQDFVLFVDPLSSRSYKKISKFNNLYRYYDESLSRKAKMISKELFERWQSVDKKSKYHLLKLKNKSLWPYFKYSFDFFFSQEFIYFLILYYEIFKKILRNENIKAIVITGATSLFDKCLIAAANQFKTPVIRIDHGIVHSEVERHPDLIGFSKHAVMSETIKKNLTKLKVKKEDITTVGPVVYDEIFSYLGPKKRKEKNILIGTIPTILIDKKNYFKRMNLALKKIKQIKGVKVAIKLHPRETSYKEYLKLIKKNQYKNVKIYKPNISREKFYTLIKNCDCFIHLGSNSALEAMIIDRPIVTMYFSNKHYQTGNWIKGSPATIEVKYDENVKGAVEKALKDGKEFRKERKKVVQQSCGNVDGKASERAVELAHQLIEQSSKPKLS